MARFCCANCGKEYRIVNRYANRKVSCPNCRMAGRVSDKTSHSSEGSPPVNDSIQTRSVRTFDLDHMVPPIGKSRSWISVLLVIVSLASVAYTCDCLRLTISLIRNGHSKPVVTCAMRDLLIAMFAGSLSFVLLQCLKNMHPFHRTNQAVTLVPALEAMAICWNTLNAWPRPTTIQSALAGWGAIPWPWWAQTPPRVHLVLAV